MNLIPQQSPIRHELVAPAHDAREPHASERETLQECSSDNLVTLAQRLQNEGYSARSYENGAVSLLVYKIFRITGPMKVHERSTQHVVTDGRPDFFEVYRASVHDGTRAHDFFLPPNSSYGEDRTLVTAECMRFGWLYEGREFFMPDSLMCDIVHKRLEFLLATSNPSVLVTLYENRNPLYYNTPAGEMIDGLDLYLVPDATTQQQQWSSCLYNLRTMMRGTMVRPLPWSIIGRESHNSH